MFTINNEDKTITATRGDICFFSVGAMQDGEVYMFQPGEVVRFKVYGKKDANTVVLQKDFPVYEESNLVDITLTEQETRIGEVISKPTDYWYEIELNPDEAPQTIIGYDDDGAKVFKLFPEGRDFEDEDSTEAGSPYIAALFAFETEAETEAKLEEIYNNMADNTCRSIVVSLNTSGNKILKGSWLATICRFSSNNGYVEITNEKYGSMIRRNLEGWNEWESENPPMVFDMEYRTTERWNGSAVYTKLIDYGKQSDGAFLAAPDGATRIVKYTASFGSFLMPIGEKGDDNYAYVVSAFPNVGLTLKKKGAGDYTTYVQLWYIKD